MYIALLGRQPALSIAELERVFTDVSWFSDTTALVATDSLDIQRLGGTQKAGKVILDLPTGDWRQVTTRLVDYYRTRWNADQGKITIGMSAYDFRVGPREVQKVGLILKAKLKQQGIGVRLVPNQESALSSATSHHNKLGLSDNKVELLIIKGDRRTIIAESSGAQNITALAARDQGRPKRDAFVGMLPPKLALLMVNLAIGNTSQRDASSSAPLRILDPFCGTGVILQEALLMHYDAYGTDLSEKMVHYSDENLAWLRDTYRLDSQWTLDTGDAMTKLWKGPIDAVATETYLGQPFSAPPSPSKLKEVQANCDRITKDFLTNIHPQLQPGTTLCLALPAWKSKEGYFTHLPTAGRFTHFGFKPLALSTVTSDELLYFRPDQVVARDIYIITRE